MEIHYLHYEMCFPRLFLCNLNWAYAYDVQVAEPDKGCITYDPRKRPWYILATAVVKDLVVLLDTGHETLETFNATVNVVSELFDTLRSNDTVNVVTFDAAAATLMQPNSVSN